MFSVAEQTLRADAWPTACSTSHCRNIFQIHIMGMIPGLPAMLLMVWATFVAACRSAFASTSVPVWCGLLFSGSYNCAETITIYSERRYLPSCCCPETYLWLQNRCAASRNRAATRLPGRPGPFQACAGCVALQATTMLRMAAR